MPALPTSQRFFAPEITKVYWLPAVAASNLTPTRAEITAGTDLSGEIADIQGWVVEGGAIPTPDLGSRFIASIPGRTSVQDSSLTLYADEAGVDVRTVLAQGDNGFILFADGGDVAGRPADVFPVRVNSVGKMRSTGDQASQITVRFNITAEPATDVDLPAAV